MYVREDPAGHQLSGIFAGSDLVRKFINDHAIDICTLIDKYTSIFRYVSSPVYCNLYLGLVWTLSKLNQKFRIQNPTVT